MQTETVTIFTEENIKKEMQKVHSLSDSETVYKERSIVWYVINPTT